MISAEPTKHTYNGNGTTRNWPFTFPIYKADGSDIKLYKTAANGTISEITANYSINVDEKYVTYPTVASELPLLTEDEKITLVRIEDLSQDADFYNQGPFNAETVEAVADKIVMMLQQIDEELSRAIIYSVDQELTEAQLSAFIINAVNLGDIELAVEECQEKVEEAQTYAAALKATSTSTVAIGIGEKTFTTQSGKQFATGQFILVVDSANSANWMYGQVTSYSGTTLVVNVTVIGGGGTKSSWNIYISGIQGVQGSVGTTSPIPIATAGGTMDAITADYDPNVSLANLTLVVFVAIAANATATPTFSPDGLTPHTIVKKGGAALVPGDIPGAGAVCILEYNLSYTRWELLNPATADKVKAAAADPSAGYLDTKVDGSTLEVASNVLRVKALGILAAHIAAGNILQSKLGYTIGNTLLISADASQQTLASSYTKLKEIKLCRGANVTVKFTLARSGGDGTAYGRIYKDGNAVGTERSTTGSGTEYAENIAITYGCSLQIYAKIVGGTGNDYVIITNFRIYVGDVLTDTVVIN